MMTMYWMQEYDELVIAEIVLLSVLSIQSTAIRLRIRIQPKANIEVWPFARDQGRSLIATVTVAAVHGKQVAIRIDGVFCRQSTNGLWVGEVPDFVGANSEFHTLGTGEKLFITKRRAGDAT